jgi:glycosyltransferase 2 family protein
MLGGFVPQDQRRGKTVGQRHLFTGLSLCLCGIALVIIWREFHRLDWVLVWTNLNHLSWLRLGTAFFFVLCSYGAIANYDLLAFRYLKTKIAPWKAIFAGFITYAISPNVGFALFSGGVLRYRLYRQWQVSPVDIAQIIAFTNLSLWVGLLPVSGLIFTLFEFPLPVALDLPIFGRSLRGFGLFCLGLSAIYGLGSLALKRPLSCRGYVFHFPSLEISLQQLVIFSLDWGFAALTLHRLFGGPIAYPIFFGIYVLAMVSGLISTMPGGLGIFETVIIFFLQSAQPEEEILATLIVFRGLYYLLPFAIAVAALLWFEYRQSRNANLP